MGKQNAAWVASIGERDVLWLLENLAEEELLKDNEDLLRLLADSLSSGHKRRLIELLVGGQRGKRASASVA